MKKNIIQSLIGASILAFSFGAMASTPSAPAPSDPCSPSCTRGANPTVNSLEANSGPYSVRTISVSNYAASGFGGGTIHYPNNVSGKMGAIAVIPGYVSYENSIKWWGPRLASHGFVVITIDTNSIYDQPNSRADQLSAALDHIIDESNSNSSSISGMIDETRLGVIGWSMGGGGSLKLSTERSINAAIPQAPYYSGSNDFDTIQTPTLILSCESDVIAPVNSHAKDFYSDLPNTTPKAILEINNGSHYCANSGYDDEDILGKYGISWMKRFLDFDSRYSQFLCGPDHEAPYSISDYRQNCNY